MTVNLIRKLSSGSGKPKEGGEAPSVADALAFRSRMQTNLRDSLTKEPSPKPKKKVVEKATEEKKEAEPKEEKPAEEPLDAEKAQDDTDVDVSNKSDSEHKSSVHFAEHLPTKENAFEPNTATAANDVHAPRPLEPPELRKLRSALKPLLKLGAHADAEADAEGILDYAVDMVMDGEKVGKVMTEVADLGFDEVCPPQSLEALREGLAEYLVKMEPDGGAKWDMIKGGGASVSVGRKSAAYGSVTKKPGPSSLRGAVAGSEFAALQARVNAQRKAKAAAPPVKKPPGNHRPGVYGGKLQTTTKVAVGGKVRSMWGDRNMSYAERLQAEERARGEAVLRNSADRQISTNNQKFGEHTGTVVGGGKRMGYAEELQARERARGEAVVKNSADSQISTNNQKFSSQSNGAVVAGGQRYGYAERLQAAEMASGQEVIKNDSSVTMRSSRRNLRKPDAGFISAADFKKDRPMSYAEQLQAEERARGEAVLKNSADRQISTNNQKFAPTTGTVVADGRGGGYAEELQMREAERGEDVVRNDSSVTMRGSQRSGMNSDVVVATGQAGGYAEQLQAEEKARGEAVIKNDSSVTMRSSQRGMSSDVVVAGGKGGGYAEQLQAEERARGEAVLKNDSSVTMRSGQQYTETVVATGKRAGYAEQLQAQEMARGEQIIKNDSSVTMRSGQQVQQAVVASGKRAGYAEQLQAREMAQGEYVVKNSADGQISTNNQKFVPQSSGVVVAMGKGLGGGGYGERLQIGEMTRGEEILKNNSTTFRAGNVDEGMYDNYQPDNGWRGYEEIDGVRYYNNPPESGSVVLGGGAEAPQAEPDSDLLAAIDKGRQEELRAIMMDKKLGKVERAEAMEEVKERYNALIQDLMG